MLDERNGSDGTGDCTTCGRIAQRTANTIEVYSFLCPWITHMDLNQTADLVTEHSNIDVS